MKKDKAYWQNYIKHAQTMKARYQIANSAGRHDGAIRRIEHDLEAARQKLRKCD